jgi:integrase
VSHAFGDICRKAEINGIRFHDLRHTHATILMKQGINPKIVQERLGHSSISVTLDVYSHVVSGMQELAALQFDAVIPALTPIHY